ncbi:MAG: FMN-binding protein [Acidobacteriota bacterium]
MRLNLKYIPSALLAGPPAIVIAGSLPAAAAVYLTVEEAQKAIFPGAAMTAVDVTLTKEQKAGIEKSSGVKVREPKLSMWRASNGGSLYVDEVLGKHEYITFAIGIDEKGAVTGLEILEYRESYGGEIRNADWRAQFRGKTAADKLVLDEDVKNVSGATLSCRHVADGVRRILATDAVLRRARR